MRITTLTILLSVIHAGAEPAVNPPSADFSDGFKRIVALGLPPLDAKATWSKLPRESYDYDYDYRFGEVAGKMKGNGWAIPSPDGKTRTLSVAATEFPADSSADQQESSPGLFGRKQNSENTSKKSFPQVDLDKDVATLITQLEKDNAERRNRYGSSMDASCAGKLMLFATQIYQTGHTRTANNLVSAIFNAYPSREAVIDATISRIANNSYQSATKQFFNTTDWATYHRALTDLQTKFPRGWDSSGAVSIFLPQVAKQAAGNKPTAPTLKDIPLDPRALAAIAQLTEKPNNHSSSADDDALFKKHGIDPSNIPAAQRAQILASLRRVRSFDSSGSSDSIWLLDPPSSEPNLDPLSLIKNLNINALPALAALLDDPFLTYNPNPRASGMSSYYGSSQEDETARALRLYQNMERPATRGEIALQLLRSTLPQSDDRSEEVDIDSLRETTLTFWKTHQKATRDELAMIFLSEGSSSQTQAAATILAASTDPKSHQALEKFLLTAESAISHYQTVNIYLTARKSAGKPFFDAYAKLVRSQAANGPAEEPSSSIEWQIKQAGGLEKILKQLESLVAGKSPRAIAKEIARGKPEEARAAIAALLPLMKELSYTKKLYALLEGAVATEDPSIRSHFLQATFQIADRSNFLIDEDVENEDQSTTPAKPDRTMPQAEIDVWRKLTADTRPVPKNQNRFSTAPTDTLADLARSALCISISPNSYYAIATAAPILQQKPNELLRARADALLDGKPIPTLPDAKRITKERLHAIVTEAGTKKELEIHSYLNTLTPDERAAWHTWWRKPGDLALPKSVKALQFTLTEKPTTKEENDASGTAADQINLGFKLTAENLTQYINSLVTEIDKHSRRMIVISPAQFGPGLAFRSNTFPLPDPKPTKSEIESQTDDEPPNPILYQFDSIIEPLVKNESASAVMSVILSNNIANHRSIWLIQNGKATLDKPDESSDRNTHESLAATIQSLIESDEPQQFVIYLNIITRSDAEKIKKLKESHSQREGDPFNDE